MLELDDGSFEKEVLKSERPILVVFWRPGCGACLAIDPVLEEVAKKLEGRVGVGKLNIFENPETTKAYRIPAVPTLIIFKNGEPVEKAVGLRSKQVLIDKLDSLI